MEYGELSGSLYQHLPAGAQEESEFKCCCRRSRDVPGHISPSKKHVRDGARVLTAELFTSGEQIVSPKTVCSYSLRSMAAR